jgi:DNA polymerase III epsilon subunit-like protein
LNLARRKLTLSKYTLAALTKRFKIDNDEAHRALSDAVATAELFLKLERLE